MSEFIDNLRAGRTSGANPAHWGYPQESGAGTLDGAPARLRGLRGLCASHAVLLMFLAAFIAVAAANLAGIGASIAVVETVQGNGSAIDAARNLRRLAASAGRMAFAAASGDDLAAREVHAASAAFEHGLAHPALAAVREDDAAGFFASLYAAIEQAWHGDLKPRLVAAGAGERAARADAALLRAVDEFVAQIDLLVSVLEREADGRIARLRMTLAVTLAVVTVFIVAALSLLRRRVFRPLNDLRASASRVGRGDRLARSRCTGPDELGQVGRAFNQMADRLSAANRELERRVEEKTSDLTRSNQTLEVLYRVISRLYHAPASPAAYEETLREIEALLGLEGSFVCMQPKHGGVGRVLFSSMSDCASRRAGAEGCARCPGRAAPWTYRHEDGRDVLLVPLRDAEHLYGMMRLALRAGRRLHGWQHALIEAVSRHMGIALGISFETERERLLGLQEERSIIARELHDSLAQSLSYLKIQASLLSPALQRADGRDEALDIVADLREGINAAYRQLRELLSTFRLRIEGDFAALIGDTVKEYSDRSRVPIDLDLRLDGCHLNANQEIHVLHIVREALSNATRHAEASRISVNLASSGDGEVRVAVEDDGKGIAPPSNEPHHYGLTIMAERARGLGGRLTIGPREPRGTSVVLRFAAPRASLAPPLADDAGCA